MSLLTNIVLIVGPIILGTYLAIIILPQNIKIIGGVICALVCIFGVKRAILDWKKERKKREEEKDDKFYRTKIEKLELMGRGLPDEYINGLGDHPELKHNFNIANKYKKEHNYIGAIEEYKKCLSHPSATNDNEVAANILIGNCYYSISQLTEAESYYRQALIISKKVKDKNERLKGEATSLGNMGLIYRVKGETDEALKLHEDALRIDREIGYRRGEASSLGNMGIIYRDKGQLDEALKYHEDALKIHGEIGHRQGEAASLGNMGIIYRDKGQLDEALKLQEDALRIDREIGYRRGEASSLGNMGLIYSDKGRLDEALKYHEDALRIDREIGHRQGEAASLGNMGLIYSDKGRLDEALKYHEDALKIFDKYNLQYGRDVIQKAVDDIKKQK